MTESSIPNPSTPAAAAAARQPPDTRANAEWFWWIAFFSLLYTLTMPHYGGVNLALGITMLAYSEFADRQSIAYAIDAIALGFFVLMGYYANRGKVWAFHLGLFVYVLDALISVWLQDWWAVGFHALGAYCIVLEMMSLRQAAASMEPMTSSSPASDTIVAVRSTASRVAKSGAKWFFWICFISFLVVAPSSSYVGSVVGIGTAQMSWVIFPDSYVISALFFRMAVYGFFCLMGLFAIGGQLWAFILGLVAYMLDALIAVWFQDWWSVAFHVVAACFILRGALALRRAQRAAA